MQSFPNEILSDIKNHLLDEKKMHLKRIAELSYQDPFTDKERVNDNAASDTEGLEESNHDRVSALIDEMKMHIVDIDKALLHIDEGTYGYCAVCKNMIDTDRLSILPMATLCQSCEGKKKRP